MTARAQRAEAAEKEVHLVQIISTFIPSHAMKERKKGGFVHTNYTDY